jgi:type VI secretion system protein ImpH
VRDYFEVPATVTQFIGQWLPLSEANRSRLGWGEVNNTLGVSAVAGKHVWDQQAKFRLQLGPLTFTKFCQFLPSGDGFRTLVAITRFSAGEEFDFDVQLMLRVAEVPWCRLGGNGEHAMRLGWSTWLKSQEFTSDADDAVFAGRLSRTGASPGGSPGARQRGAP